MFLLWWNIINIVCLFCSSKLTRLCSFNSGTSESELSSVSDINMQWSHWKFVREKVMKVARWLIIMSQDFAKVFIKSCLKYLFYWKHESFMETFTSTMQWLQHLLVMYTTSHPFRDPRLSCFSSSNQPQPGFNNVQMFKVSLIVLKT
jgi:hypothetical protein